MAAPPLSVINVRGGTPLQIFPLLNGTTLGNQDGIDVAGATTEAGAAANYRTGNRCIEVFGKRFSASYDDIYEKDTGGAGMWGSVHSRTSGPPLDTGSAQSGLHLVHPGGVPTLASLYVRSDASLAISRSIDGTVWTDTIVPGASGATVHAGHSIAFRDSIFWFQHQNGSGHHVVEFNLLTAATTLYTLAQVTGADGGRQAAFAVVDNELYLCGVIADPAVATDDYLILRLSLGAWVTAVTLAGVDSGLNGDEGGCAAWADGSDLMVMVGGEGDAGGADGDSFFRIATPAGTPSSIDVSSQLLTAGNGGDVYAKGGGSGVQTATWEVAIDNASDPVVPAVNLWRYPGPGQAGTREAWTFQHRLLTYTTLTGAFVAGETVTQATSGATGRVTADSGTAMNLTDVVGTFDNTNGLTGGTSGATATSSSLLVEQPLIADGASITADYAIPHTIDGIGPRIPAAPAARAELGAEFRTLAHTPIGGTFTVGELITGGTSGATAYVRLVGTGILEIYGRVGTFTLTETLTGGDSGATATLDTDTISSAIPVELVGGITQYWFRVTGTGVAVTIDLYGSLGEEIPGGPKLTIQDVTVEAGAPATTPAVAGGSINNLTPDSGETLYSLTTDFGAVGDRLTLALDAN